MSDSNSSLVRPIRLSDSEIAKLILKRYGLQVEFVKELDSYDDRNYLVQDVANSLSIGGQNPRSYVLKVLNSVDSKEPKQINMQNDVILYAKKAGFPVPAPVMNLEGFYQQLMSFENKARGITETSVVRLFEFFPGTTLEKVTLTRSLCYQIGHYAGWLDKIYQNYLECDTSTSKLLVRDWNLAQLPSLWPHLNLDVIKDSQKLAVVKSIVSAFEEEVLKHEDRLSRGIIHSDINDCNLVVSETSDSVRDMAVGNGSTNGQPMGQSNGEKEARHHYNIIGVIDFGDMTWSCLLYEVAIAIAYVLINKSVPPLEAAGCVLAGYLKHINLSEFELERLKICVCARMTQSMVMSLLTLKVNPDNTYNAFHATRMWGPMQTVWSMSNNDFLQELYKHSS